MLQETKLAEMKAQCGVTSHDTRGVAVTRAEGVVVLRHGLLQVLAFPALEKKKR